jgi:phosphoglycolate phosphatase
LLTGTVRLAVTEDYDGVVYDLDGTLVRLDVDWSAARRDAAGVLSARGVDVEGRSLWDLLELAVEHGYRRPVEDAIAHHERRGARTAERLPAADNLPHPCPVGVCSLNATAACRIALELHGLDDAVDAVVGRDSLDSYKPDPAPLLAVLDELAVDPGRALFVGDTERDQETARRAGVDFAFVADRVDAA